MDKTSWTVYEEIIYYLYNLHPYNNNTKGKQVKARGRQICTCPKTNIISIGLHKAFNVTSIGKGPYK